MSEYNIQMNKYNALNTKYDQLYPVTKIKNVDGLDTALQSKPNPNLLDNWYFGNPVDQRQGRIVKPNTTYYSDNQLTTSAGTTSAYVTAYRYATGTVSGVNYASFKLTDSDTAPTYYAAPENVVRGYTGAGYGIDRWKFGNIGTVLIKDGYIQVTQDWGINQLFPALPTGTYTVSVLIRKSTAPSLRFAIADVADLWFTDYESEYAKGDSWTLISKTFNGAPANVSIDSAGVTSTFELYAAKLELGSQQTLAHQENGVWQLNEIPDYGEQLARCQRYHFEFGPSHALIAYDEYGVNSPVVYFPVQMRTVSAIKVYSKAGTENAITYWTGSAEVDFTDFNLEWNENFVTLRSINGAFVPGGIYSIGKLIAYADL